MYRLRNFSCKMNHFLDKAEIRNENQFEFAYENDNSFDKEELYDCSAHEDITIKVEPSEVLWLNIQEESKEEEQSIQMELTEDQLNSICQDPPFCGSIAEDISQYLKCRGNGFSSETINAEFEAGVKDCLERKTFLREGRKFYGCSNCPFVTNNEEGFRSHFRFHFEGKLRDETRRKLDAAKKRRNKKEKTFRCTLCDYSTVRRDTLKVHQLKHSDLKPLKCDQCEYRTKRKDTLKVHQLKHSTMKLWKCDSCDYQTNHKSELRIHELNHNAETKLYKCDLCPYESNRKSHMKGHLMTHTRIKRFKCSECVYTTNQKTNLKGHMLLHAEKRRLLKCLHCNFETKEKVALDNHLAKTHDDDAADANVDADA